MGTIKRGRPRTGPPPSGPGLYRILEDVVIGLFRKKKVRIHKYHGESNDLSRRMKQHQKSGMFNPKTDRFLWQPADGRSTSRTRRIAEMLKILKHMPYMNKSKGGEGRRAK